ncbi:MAG: restriction endonuclease subunit S [Alphaproteobacteria bacterium]|nr:restriction endonuclease subunit S [Alphaproteobacteria bacterium]
MRNKAEADDMPTDAKTALVPKLRFPEFREARAWEVKAVGDVFRTTRGHVLPMSSVKDEPSPSAPYPVYSSQTKNGGLAGYYSSYLFEDAITWTTDGANAGDVNFRSGRFYCTNVCGVLVNSQGYANACVAALLNSVTRDHVSYVGNPKLMNGVMEKIEIPFPSLAEQHLIADCLSSADEAISAQARKVDALTKHKKGLMQQLFPREGETKNCLPERRFPEFRNEAMWHPSELGSIAVILKGKGITKADLDPDGLQACIRYGELYTRYGEIISKVVSRTKVAPSQLFFSEPNDVIIPSSGETKIDIAKASCVLAGGIALGGDLNVIRTKLNGIFLSYYLNGPKRLDIAKVAQGDTVVHLYPHQLEALHIAVPSIAEQQRIASCLSSLDSLISAEIQKFDTLKIHKKSLMQQLFPPSKGAEK